MKFFYNLLINYFFSIPITFSSSFLQSSKSLPFFLPPSTFLQKRADLFISASMTYQVAVRLDASSLIKAE